MKKSIILLSFFALIFSACDRNLYGVKPDEGGENSTTLEKTAFTRGVNLSGCFDVTPSADAGSIWMGTITEDSFTNLQSLGCGQGSYEHRPLRHFGSSGLYA